MALSRSELQIILSAKDRASSEFQKAGGSLEKFAKVAAVATAAAGALAIGIGVKAVQAASKFEAAMSNVNTLFDDNGESVAVLEKGVKDLLKTIPKSADDLGAAAYQVVSAGITNAADALNVLESSGKLAVAGLGTTEEAVNLITSAVNAFGIEATKSNKVADVIFKTVKAGKTTVGELAQAFGNVAAAAQGAGISLEETQAATAALTTVGFRTTTAQERLRALFDEMTRSSGKLAEGIKNVGISNIETALKTDGFKSVLDKLLASAGGNTIEFKNMFSSVEAGGAALALVTGASDIYTNTLNSMRDGSSKVDEAFEKQTQTFAAQYELLKNNLNVVLIELGSAILPILNKAMEPLIEVIKKLNDSASKAGDIFSLLKEKVNEVINFIESNTGLITIFKQAFDDVAIVVQEHLWPALQQLWELLQPLMPFIKVLAQVFGVILLGALIGVVKVIEGALIVTIETLTGIIQTAIVAAEGLKNIWDTWVLALSKVVTWIDTLIKKIEKLNVVQGAKNAIGGFLGFGGERATGGAVSARRSYLVGEKGPELFTPNISGAILPNSSLGGGSIVININGGMYLSDDAAEMMGNKIVDKLKSNIRI